MLVKKGMGLKKKLVLTGIILINLIIIGVVVLNTFKAGAKKEPEFVLPKPAEDNQALAPEKKAEEPRDLDKRPIYSFFNDPIFKELQIHGDLSLKIKKMGRSNPFEMFALEGTLGAPPESAE